MGQGHAWLECRASPWATQASMAVLLVLHRAAFVQGPLVQQPDPLLNLLLAPAPHAQTATRAFTMRWTTGAGWAPLRRTPTRSPLRRYCRSTAYGVRRRCSLVHMCLQILVHALQPGLLMAYFLYGLCRHTCFVLHFPAYILPYAGHGAVKLQP